MTASPVEAAAGQAIDAFGLDLYKALQAEAGGSGNLFLSPFSIETALAMTYAGARGETAAQMASTLHLSGDQAAIAQEFGSLLGDLNSAGGSAYTLAVADALWGQQGLDFLTPFLDTMQSDYGGGLNQLDFLHDPEGARATINQWVADHTNDKIENLFPASSIDSLTRLVLANAIYFKGDWATAFDAAATYNAGFTLASGGQEQVSTMHRTDYYRYMQSDGYQVVEIPYSGGRLAMDVLLPTGSGARGLSVSHLPSDLNSWLGGLSTQDVGISLPKFTLTTQFDLSAQLKALGMGDAFSDNANFSGMTDVEQLKISQVLHKAYIGVNESGSEATAATGVIMTAITGAYEPPTIPIDFNADHPFLFMIRDTQTGSVLFMGQEADPLSTGGDASAPAIDPGAAIAPPAITIAPTAPWIFVGPLPPQPIFVGPTAPIFVGPVAPIRVITLPPILVYPQPINWSPVPVSPDPSASSIFVFTPTIHSQFVALSDLPTTSPPAASEPASTTTETPSGSSGAQVQPLLLTPARPAVAGAVKPLTAAADGKSD